MLKTQGQHICISELQFSFDGFTYSLRTQGQHIWISELPLSSGGFTYSLKTQGQHILLVNYHCHLMNSLTS